MCQRVTAANIVCAISQLPRDRVYNYISNQNSAVISIVDVVRPEGPITIRRYNPAKGQTFDTARDESISSQMIWRIANAIRQNEPINFDRILGASYNTRSALEALLAHTPQFYFCYPGRVENIDGRITIRGGHKHLIWLPHEPHENAVLMEHESNMVVSEIPIANAVYNDIVLPAQTGLDADLDIDIARRHSQIQVALYFIGRQLGYRTWIAQNDRGIIYNDRTIAEYENVVPDLRQENIIAPFDGAIDAAAFIDCIWFRNHRFMPAVMEVEHTTGVTSGLTRMLGLYNHLPPINTNYVIVAPDEDRQLVIRECNRPEFRPLRPRYFPYSSVEELFYICQRRHLHGITDEFLECYMEPTLEEA